MKVQKGQKVQIKNNEILSMMGVKTATGIVQSLHTDGNGFSFKCDQTNSIETADYGDGELEIVS